MDKFIIDFDYRTLIKSENLAELNNPNRNLLHQAIDEAVEEAASYIRHRYDTSKVFKPVQIYEATKEKTPTDEDDYDATETYETGDIIQFTDDKVYVANQAVLAGESPTADPTKWDVVAYVIDDRLFDQGNEVFYTAIDTAITGDTLTDTDLFTQGDDRNQKLKTVVVDILLYNIHSRLSPRMIPDLRRMRYDGDGKLKDSANAIKWLIDVQRGVVSPNLQVITDTDGTIPQNSERASWGISSTSKYK